MVFSFFWLLPLRNFMSKTPDTKLNFPTQKAGTFSVWGTSLIDKFTSDFEKNTEKWDYWGDRSDSAGNAPVKKSEFPSTCELREERIPPPNVAMSARVFDMKLRNGNNQKNENTIQVGIMGIDVASEGPLKCSCEKIRVSKHL